MKCERCNSVWYSSIVVESCPFCHAALSEEVKHVREQIVCPICTDDYDGVLCRKCGYDASGNVLKYPTLVPKLADYRSVFQKKAQYQKKDIKEKKPEPEEKKAVPEISDKIRQEARVGNVLAQVSLADYFLGLKQYRQAAAWYKEAAERDNAYAQVQYANMIMDGNVLESGEYEAIKWYENAASQNDTSGIMKLAECYEKGRGVRKNVDKAANLYLKAYLQGSVEAQYCLGRIYEAKNMIGTAISYYRGAAIKGHAESQYTLGKMYSDDTGGMKHLNAASEWFRRAAEQGHREAQIRLAKILAAQNKNAEASAWLQRAQEKRDS